MAAGGEWGSDTIVLQASEMGQSLYQRMGFRTVERHVEYIGGFRAARQTAEPMLGGPGRGGGGVSP